MGGGTYVVIALLIVLVIAAAVALARRGRAGCAFMPGDPAPPKLQSAIYMIGGDLDCIARLADEIEERGEGMEARLAPGGEAAAEAAQSLAGARQAITEIRFSVKRLRATVGTMTPTYLNVLGLYRGLRDGDAAFWGAAANLEAAGGRMAALSSGAAPAALSSATRQELRATGARLDQLSTCLHNLSRTVHHLGGALELE
jgi:hypothetical protein